MSWLSNKKHILLILTILTISVEIQAICWSRLYPTCVFSKVGHAVAMAERHPIISLIFLLGGGLFVYKKISKRLNQDIWEAVNKGDARLVSYYLWRGFDIHAKNEFGNKLIHHAAMSDQVDIIKTLLNHDPSIIKSLDGNKKTVLAAAAEVGQKKQ